MPNKDYDYTRNIPPFFEIPCPQGLKNLEMS